MIFLTYLILFMLKPFCQASKNYLEQDRLTQEVKESLFERMVEFIISKHFLIKSNASYKDIKLPVALRNIRKSLPIGEFQS